MCCDRSNAWKTARVMFGVNNNLSPTLIKVEDHKGGYQEVTDTGKLAELFNEYFKAKVDQLRQKTNQPPLVPPASRLRKWLSNRSSPPPPLQLTEIDKA